MATNYHSRPTQLIPLEKKWISIWIEVWWSRIFVRFQDIWWAILFGILIVSMWTLLDYFPVLMPNTFSVPMEETSLKGDYRLLVLHPKQLIADRSLILNVAYDHQFFVQSKKVTASKSPNINTPEICILDSTKTSDTTLSRIHTIDQKKVLGVDSIKEGQINASILRIVDSVERSNVDTLKVQNNKIVKGISVDSIVVNISSRPKSIMISPSKLSFKTKRNEPNLVWYSVECKIPNLVPSPKTAKFAFEVIAGKTKYQSLRLELSIVRWPNYILQLVGLLSSAGILGVKSVGPLIAKIVNLLWKRITSTSQ